mmetsp:Transcript_13607/g.23244  ORF Transcript_13607/g.23244 Transcript_13607/m.23244 type:complete len:222 (+) Transcript_13607:207-872(+)
MPATLRHHCPSAVCTEGSAGSLSPAASSASLILNELATFSFVGRKSPSRPSRMPNHLCPYPLSGERATTASAMARPSRSNCSRRVASSTVSSARSWCARAERHAISSSLTSAPVSRSNISITEFAACSSSTRSTMESSAGSAGATGSAAVAVSAAAAKSSPPSELLNLWKRRERRPGFLGASTQANGAAHRGRAGRTSVRTSSAGLYAMESPDTRAIGCPR